MDPKQRFLMGSVTRDPSGVTCPVKLGRALTGLWGLEPGGLKSGGLEPGGLEARATDSGAGRPLTWGSTAWGSRGSGYRFWSWQTTYLGV